MLEVGVPGERGPARCRSSGLTLARMATMSTWSSPKFLDQSAQVPLAARSK